MYTMKGKVFGLCLVRIRLHRQILLTESLPHTCDQQSVCLVSHGYFEWSTQDNYWKPKVHILFKQVGLFCTYNEVLRALENNGFEIERSPGFNQGREGGKCL